MKASNPIPTFDSAISRYKVNKIKPNAYAVRIAQPNRRNWACVPLELSIDSGQIEQGFRTD